MAVKAACDTIRDRMAEFLAAEHQADPARVGSRTARCMWAAQLYLRRGRDKAYHGARQPVGDRVLQDAQDRLGPDQGRGPAVLLLRLWRRGDRGGDRHADRRKPHPARRYPARRRRLAEPGARYRPGRGRLCAGRGLADDGRAGLGRQGPAAHPRALDLQDPRLLGPARRVQRRALGPGPQPRGHDLPLQGGGRAAFHAGHLGASWRCRTPWRPAATPIRRWTRPRRRNAC